VNHKKRATKLSAISSPNNLLTDFENYYFTGKLCGQFATELSLKISPHPKCVATLPCELQFSK